MEVLARLTPARRAKALAVAGVVVLAVQVAYWLPNHVRRRDVAALDFAVYRRAAREVAAGASPYARCAPADPSRPPGCFMYPPLFAAVARPLASLSDGGFQTATYVIVLAAFWAFAAGLGRLVLGRATVAGTLGAAALLLPVPGVLTSMSYGNVDLAVWALCAWGLSAPALAPLLVIAAGLKVYPAFALAVLLMRWPRRLLLPVALTAAAAAAVTLAVVGWRASVDFLTVGGWGVLQWGTAPRNVSLSTAAVRLLEHLGLAAPGSAAARVFLILAAPAGAAITAVAMRRQSPPMQAAAVLVAALALGPICWWYYLPALLIPVAIAWGERRASSRAAAPAPARPAR